MHVVEPRESERASRRTRKQQQQQQHDKLISRQQQQQQEIGFSVIEKLPSSEKYKKALTIVVVCVTVRMGCGPEQQPAATVGNSAAAASRSSFFG